MNAKEKIIRLFMENKEKEIHIREISRILKISATTASKYLNLLEKEDILKSEKKLGHLIYKPKESLQFKSKKTEYNLEKINSSGLIDYLVKEFEPETIILFGSFAKADNINSSDIDLLVITPRKKDISLDQFEKKLGHKIQLFVHSHSEIEKIKEKNKELLNNWINGIKLYGYLELFK